MACSEYSTSLLPDDLRPADPCRALRRHSICSRWRDVTLDNQVYRSLIALISTSEADVQLFNIRPLCTQRQPIHLHHRIEFSLSSGSRVICSDLRAIEDHIPASSLLLQNSRHPSWCPVTLCSFIVWSRTQDLWTRALRKPTAALISKSLDL